MIIILKENSWSWIQPIFELTVLPIQSSVDIKREALQLEALPKLSREDIVSNRFVKNPGPYQ